MMKIKKGSKKKNHKTKKLKTKMKIQIFNQQIITQSKKMMLKIKISKQKKIF